MATFKVVNKALAGEPEHAVLQNIENNDIFEFSQIAGETISDNDINHTTIKAILAKGHVVDGEIQNGELVLRLV